MPKIKEAASEFLASKRVAVTGVSRQPKNHGSNADLDNISPMSAPRVKLPVLGEPPSDAGMGSRGSALWSRRSWVRAPSLTL